MSGDGEDVPVTVVFVTLQAEMARQENKNCRLWQFGAQLY